jgi:C1A family cysteine protease
MLEKRDNRWYGWKRSIPSIYDYEFVIPRRYGLISAVPRKANNKSICPPVMEQGSIGSCVANATTAAMRADRVSQRLSDIPLSRLQLYWDGREAEGDLEVDAGMEVRTAFKLANKNGVAPETLWPYDVKKWREKPPLEVYVASKANAALEYARVDQNIHAIKAALASGHLVVFGMVVYESFESAKTERTGIVQMPNPKGERDHGGHCMYLHSYDDDADPTRVWGTNSWGTDWGFLGDFSIPWNYVCHRNLADDFWVVTTVGPEKLAEFRNPAVAIA